MVDNSIKGRFRRLFSSVASTENLKTPLYGVGKSGTEIYSGQFDEEYLDKLKNLCGIELYQQMRRSDAQVVMLLSVVKNPITSAKWSVEAADESDEEKEIAALVEHALFEDMGYPDGSKRKTWQEFIQEALNFIDYGHTLFEKVHKVVIDHPRFGDYIGLKDLAYRHPKTIYEWNTFKNGGLKSVRQQQDGDLAVDVLIPGRHLLVFSNRKEGDNYEGISALRAIYGNYFRKNVYHRIQAIGIERGANGVPVGTVDKDIAGRDDYDAQYEQFLDVLEKFSAHQSRSLALPPGFSLEEYKINHDADKVKAVIEAENIEMSKAFLANFMELGVSGQSSGSYSLGTDLSDIFLSGIQLYAEQICEKITRDVIKDIVEFKYGQREVYPKLRCTGINDKAGKELAEIINLLVTGGITKPDDRLRSHLHKQYRLPEPDFDAEDEVEDAEVAEALESMEKDPELSETLPAYIRLAEQNVPQKIDARAEQMEGLMKTELNARSDDFIARIVSVLQREPDSTKRKKALAVEMRGQRKYSNQLLSFLSSVGDEARRDVLSELGKSDLNLADAETKENLLGLPKSSRQKITSEVDLIVKDQDAQIEKVVLFTVNSNLDTTDSVDQIEREMKIQRDKYVDGAAIRVGAVNFVSSVTNGVRNDVFQTPEVFDDIESFVYFNTSPKAAICKNLNGRVFSKDEYKTSPLLPPNHHNCKSIVVAQTEGATGNKDVSPVGLQPTGTEDQIETIMKSKTL